MEAYLVAILIVTAIYVLLSLGLTLQYGVARIMNLSYGETLVAASFAAMALYTGAAVNPLLGLLLVVLGLGWWFWSALFAPDVLEITVESALADRDVPGGTAPGRARTETTAGPPDSAASASPEPGRSARIQDSSPKPSAKPAAPGARAARAARSIGSGRPAWISAASIARPLGCHFMLSGRTPLISLISGNRLLMARSARIV